MTHFLRYKNKGVIEKSLTSLISLTPPVLFFSIVGRTNTNLLILLKHNILHSLFLSLPLQFVPFFIKVLDKFLLLEYGYYSHIE